MPISFCCWLFHLPIEPPLVKPLQYFVVSNCTATPCLCTTCNPLSWIFWGVTKRATLNGCPRFESIDRTNVFPVLFELDDSETSPSSNIHYCPRSACMHPGSNCRWSCVVDGNLPVNIDFMSHTKMSQMLSHVSCCKSAFRITVKT